MEKLKVCHFESGLIIGQVGIEECVKVPNLLKENFYETLLTACLNGGQVSWSDLDGNRLLLHYEFKNKFNVFINGKFIGDLPFIPLSKTSIAIPVETDGTFDYFEVYDSILMECYLLEKEEVLRLSK